MRLAIIYFLIIIEKFFAVVSFWLQGDSDFCCYLYKHFLDFKDLNDQNTEAIE
jgi:hypothetical protein